MTDRELLELAAKSIGEELVRIEGSKAWLRTKAWPLSGELWNPLTHDGDALRLAVKLQMQVTCYVVCTDASAYGKDSVREIGDDPYAATRRAIVRAAAEVGKAIK